MARHMKQKHPAAYKEVKRLQTEATPASSEREEGNAQKIKLKRSWIWKYMTRLSDKDYRCNICRKILRTTNNSLSNLKQHIKFKHTFIYDEEMSPDHFQDGNHHEEASASSKTKEGNVENTTLKRSWIWKYMTQLGGKNYRCNLCRRIIRMSQGIYFNMKRHMKFKHTDVYDKEMCQAPFSVYIKEEDGFQDGNNFKKDITKLSWIRKYIIKTAGNEDACDLCNALIKMQPGSLSNVKRHFKAKHPYIYEKETNLNFDYNSEDSNDINVETEKEIFDDKEEVIDYTVTTKAKYNTENSDHDKNTKSDQGENEQEPYVEEEYIVEYLVEDTPADKSP